MRGKRERNERMGWRGVLRGWLDIYYLPLLKGDLPQENSIYMCIFLNTSSSFQLSLALKHTSQITFVCGCSIMISVASQRCFCDVVVFFWGGGSRQVVGGGKGEHDPESPGAVKRSQSREGWGGRCPHHTGSHHHSSKIQHKWRKPLPLPSCLSYVLLSFSLSSRTAYKTWVGQRCSSSI